MLRLKINEVGETLPPRTPHSNSRVEIWRDNAGAVYACGELLGEECWLHVPEVANFRFTRQGDEVSAEAANGVRQDLILDAYRRKVLPLAVQIRGHEVLHASAVRTPAGIVGLCGESQAGKSTTAFGLSQRGYSVWCDDALALDINNERTLAISLPFRLRLRPTARELFGENVVEESATLPGAETVPVAALCVLLRAEDDAVPVRLRRLPFVEAFLAILGHACWFTLHDAQDKRRVIDHYMDLAAQIPIFEVSFKSGLENLPAVLDAIEATLPLKTQAA